MLYYLRWIAAAPLLLLFFWAAALNLGIVALMCRNALTGERKRVPSFAPFIGGVAGVVGLLLCPVESVSRYAWLALVLDPSVPCFVLMPLFLLLSWFTGKEPSSER